VAGGTAVDVEELVTRPIEQKIAENTHIHPASASDYGIKSLTLPGSRSSTFNLMRTSPTRKSNSPTSISH